MKICLDAGHAIEGAIGARGLGYKEEVLTREIVEKLKWKFSHLGHQVIICSCDKEKDGNKQLKKIVEVENKSKADLFISIHLNAFRDAKAKGVETYSIAKNGVSHTYAIKVQEELVKLGYANRGKKEANYFVLRHTKAPAILVECGFITNEIDMSLYNADRISSAIVEAITGKTTNEIVYRVITGSYKNKENAVQHIKELKIKGIDAFISKEEL